MVEQKQGIQDIMPLAAGPNAADGENPTTNQPSFINGYTGIHHFFTTASILTSSGVFEVKKVEVDERSPISLLPMSIAVDLGLIMSSGDISAFTISDCSVQTSQYSHFSIQVAGHSTTILAGVASNIDMIILGLDWIYRVNLLNGIGNQKYYISIPLSTAAPTRSGIKSGDIKLRRIAVSEKASKKYDEFYLSDGSLSLDDKTLSEDSFSQECSEDEDYDDDKDEYEDDDEDEEEYGYDDDEGLSEIGDIKI